MTDARRILRPMSEMSEPNRVPSWTLGWRLKRSLAEAKVGAGDMADYLGYSKAQISRYLNDKGEPPRAQTLRLWAMRCGVSFDWLAYGIEAEPGTPPGLEVSPSTCNGAAVIAFRARDLSPHRRAA